MVWWWSWAQLIWVWHWKKSTQRQLLGTEAKHPSVLALFCFCFEVTMSSRVIVIASLASSFFLSFARNEIGGNMSCYSQSSEVFCPFFLAVLDCHYPVLDGLDQHFQDSVHFPLTSAIDKSQRCHNKFWEHRESNPGLLGEKQECYLCAIFTYFLFSQEIE